MTHWNSVVFFKKFVLVVYSSGDSACVVHASGLQRRQSLPSSASVAYLLYLFLAFTPGCSRASWISTSVSHFFFLPPLTQLPMLWTWIYQYPSTVIHSESLHRSCFMWFTKHPPWVLFLFLIASIRQVLIICQALCQELSPDYLN